jgi:hypothetical protein
MKYIPAFLLIPFFFIRCSPPIVGSWHIVIDSFAQYPDPVQYHIYPGRRTDSFTVSPVGMIWIKDSAGLRTLNYHFKTDSFVTSSGVVQGFVIQVTSHQAYVWLDNNNGMGDPHSTSMVWRYHLER